MKTLCAESLSKNKNIFVFEIEILYILIYDSIIGSERVSKIEKNIFFESGRAYENHRENRISEQND